MENWLKVNGYDWLEVSDYGRVRTIDSERQCIRAGRPQIQRKKGVILRPFIGRHGYKVVAPKIGKNRRKLLVHRLVATAFVGGYFPNASVNHIDNNKTNNHWTNLEWVTLAENTRKQWRDGLVNLRGENHPSSKLTAAQIRTIRESTKSYTQLAKEFNVSFSLIRLIIKRERWASI